MAKWAFNVLIGLVCLLSILLLPILIYALAYVSDDNTPGLHICQGVCVELFLEDLDDDQE